MTELSIAVVCILFIVIGFLLWLYLKIIAINSALKQALAQQEQDFRQFYIAQNEQALNLQDSFIDRFYMLNTSLNSSLSKTNELLLGSLKNIDDGFKVVGQKVASIEHLGELKQSVEQLGRIFSSQKLRGKYGEIELERILELSYAAPGAHYALQKQLGNGKIADCVLYMSAGWLCIDSKFPLENFWRLSEAQDDKAALSYEKEFEKDIKKHITDIATRYILPPQTMPYAIAFIPAEAVYVRACSLGLLEFGLERKIFLASPSTLLALCYSFCLLKKDEAIARDAIKLRGELAGLSKYISELDQSRSSLRRHLQNASTQLSLLDAKVQSLAERLARFGVQE